MPTNKKENLQFGFLMCFGMVLVMTIYNFYLHGTIHEMTFMEGVLNFLIAFIVAFILDLFIVGPTAKKVAFKLTARTSKKLYKILAISISMVIGMAALMSMFGLVTMSLHSGFHVETVVTDYLTIFGSNFILALPLQLIVMGPLVRFLFTKFIQSPGAASATV
ncbi:DUF2798 domain-containing protein [Bacillus sp. SB49]|uniref:DUF2798 domain-containing protein n=1 Tax=Bacillus sp. SB49 TaxID=1071080 RepID=UPI0004233E30|nr:DUF2798 domain-containing protein [Bacillus sp. SB49]QHT47855.1 DUF2798 domain-containing protein [Bacillus sp. SB49]